MYKKVYIEITNVCNLNCDFCIKNKRDKKVMTLEEFKIILSKLKGYTKYLYFHVLGEPFIHPNINEFIDIASSDYYINITTNGYLINQLNTKNIRQINISLHSFNERYNVSLFDYMNNIFSVIDDLDSTYICFRLWAKTKYKDDIIKMLEDKYKTKIDNNMKIKDNIYIAFEHEFEWPSLDKEVISDKGTCYALKDHIAVLSNGTIVPCCLDSMGCINLGNIYKDELSDVINSKRYQEMLNCFKNNKKVEELCKRCNFINK